MNNRFLNFIYTAINPFGRILKQNVLIDELQKENIILGEENARLGRTLYETQGKLEAARKMADDALANSVSKRSAI